MVAKTLMGLAVIALCGQAAQLKNDNMGKIVSEFHDTVDSIIKTSLAPEKPARRKVLYPWQLAQMKSVHDGCTDCSGAKFECCCCEAGAPQGGDCVCCDCPLNPTDVGGFDLLTDAGICQGATGPTATCYYDPDYGHADVANYAVGDDPATIKAAWTEGAGIKTVATPQFFKTEVSAQQCEELCRRYTNCLGVSFKGHPATEADPPAADADTDCILHYNFDATTNTEDHSLKDLGHHYVCNHLSPHASAITTADGTADYICLVKPATPPAEAIAGGFAGTTAQEYYDQSTPPLVQQNQ